MKFFLHHFFHHETNDRSEKGRVVVPHDRAQWPASWTHIEYKRYSMFPPVLLEREEPGVLGALLAKRRSNTGSIEGNVVSRGALSSVLRYGAGLQEGTNSERTEHRTYPSAGMRYPIEAYLFLFKAVDALPSGIYHYAVKEHALEPVRLMDFSPELIHSFSSMEWLPTARGMVVLTGVFPRVVMKYGSRGYRYVLLEAGHVAQNMLLAGTTKQMNMIPLGGVNEKVIEQYMGLNTLDEQAVYVLAF